MYIEKHCTHVARSGINFFGAYKSIDCTRRTCPSQFSDVGFALPFAGGSSVKTTYSPLRIICATFWQHWDTWGHNHCWCRRDCHICLSLSAASFPVPADLLASLIFANDFSIGALGIAPSCTPAMVHTQPLSNFTYLHRPQLFIISAQLSTAILAGNSVRVCKCTSRSPWRGTLGDPFFVLRCLLHCHDDLACNSHCPQRR